MAKLTLRGYVWAFCTYLALTINRIAHHDAAIRPPHHEHDFFFTLFPNILAPAFVIFVFLSLVREFNNALMKIVLILSAATFLSNILFALYQYEYISFGIPHWLSGWCWFFATVLLGYRTDQLLKKHNKEIEAN